MFSTCLIFSEIRIDKSKIKQYTWMVEVALSILIIVIVLNPAILSSLTGSQAPMAVVKGESMLPVLREGDIVFTYKPNPSEIRIGDVIVYKTYTNKLIIHRVVEVRIVDGKHYYVTRGDNNPGPDIIYFDVVNNRPLGVSYDRVVGKVLSVDNFIVKIPYLGYISLWFQEIRSSIT
ncbi:MAG: signal peptidase I [Thermosphaera aggregans]|uniref:signal peptidase I n=1 Tax=Thermosphaera aggregans TaxID=54254 RepID=UPI003C0BCE9B